MFRSLPARAIVPVAVAVTGFVVIACLLLYSVMKADLTADAVRYETSLADTIVKSTRYAMLRGDRETVRNIVANVGEQLGVEHVRIFNKRGMVMFSGNEAELHRLVDKADAGCIGCHAGPVPVVRLGEMKQARRFVNRRGTAVIAIAAPIRNEPACFTAACHVHPATQKLLGTLDIGLSATPLERTLVLLKSRMAVFSGMVLMLSVGGVAALLRRNVFVPLEKITAYAARINRGTLDVRTEGIHGELVPLASTLRELAHRLEHAERELAAMRRDPCKTLTDRGSDEHATSADSATPPC